MKTNNKKKIAALTVATVLAGQNIQPILALGNEKASKTTVDLRIMATTDLHANIMDYDYYTDKQDTTLGLSRVATLIEQARKESDKNNNLNDSIDNTILVDNGDTIQGNPLASVYAMNSETKVKPGEKYPVYEALDILGYDATTLGNHEFNYGLDFLNQITDKSVMDTSVINANVYDMEGNPLFDQYKIINETVIDSNGNEQTVKIGLTGFVPPQILNWDKQHLDGKVTVKDIKISADEITKKLKEEENVDIVVALAHTGTGSTDEYIQGAENAAYQLTKVEGMDVVVAGHSHSTADKNLNGVQIIQPANWGKELGIVDLKLEQKNGKWEINDDESKIERRSVKELKPENSKLIVDNESLKRAHEATVNYVNQPVGKTTEDLNSFFSLVQDDASVELVANAQIWYANKKMDEGQEQLKKYENLPILSASAPFKAGGRSFDESTNFVDIKAGDLKIKDLSNLYIYDNTISIIKVNGTQLKEWLEMVSGMFNTIDTETDKEQELLNSNYRSYNFDSIQGVTYEIDVTKPAKYDKDGNLLNENTSRITNLKYEGKDIPLDKEFLVVTNNYRAGGNFPGVREAELVYASADENREAITNYIKETGEITPTADNNWKIKSVNTNSVVTFKSHKDAKNYIGSTNKIGLLENYDNGISKYTYNLNSLSFIDTDNHWAKVAIDKFVSEGHIKGYGDGTFKPNNQITRAEFISIINSVYNFNNNNTRRSFNDVSTDAWYYDEVCAAANAGYIDGYEDGTFRPNQYITREEAAAILVKMTGIKGDGNLNIKDVNEVSDWAKEYIDAASDNGILVGYEDGTYKPKSSMTRAEAVTMLARLSK